jgi:hypothetical protein
VLPVPPPAPASAASSSAGAGQHHCCCCCCCYYQLPCWHCRRLVCGDRHHSTATHQKVSNTTVDEATNQLMSQHEST